jgi:hypothetical protein
MRLSLPALAPVLCGAGLFFAAHGPASAAVPVVSAVDLRGLEIGRATRLTFTGTDLLPNPRLLTTAKLKKQTLLPGGKPERIVLEVELEEASQPGLENWWLVTDGGISSRSLLATDALPQKVFSEKVDSLPVALHGSVAGSQVREVRFSAKAGQELLCEVEAQRLESRLRPALKLFGPAGNLLKLALPRTALRGDTRLEVTLPTDGEYLLQLHDLQFAAAAPGHFRLKMGSWFYADLAFPSTIQRGMTAEVQLLGRAGKVTSLWLPSSQEGRAVPAPWPDSKEASGPAVPVWLHELPQTLEERSGAKAQPLEQLPVSVNGWLSKPGEVDLYEIPVEPETEVEFLVAADVLGSPIDAELELRDLKGARLAVSDDTPEGPDPKLTYKVPKDTTKITAAVRDVNANGGALCIYRFQAVRKPPQKPPAFALKLLEDNHTVLEGRKSVLKVEALRDGYDGPIELVVESLPPGLQVSGQTIPAAATGTLLTLSGEGEVPPSLLALKGRTKELEVPVRYDSGFLGKNQPWLEGALAVTAAPAPEFEFSAGWGKGIESRRIALTGKMSLPLECKRPAGHDGPVRLTLLTSQARVLANGAVDPNKMLREEKAVLLEEDKKAQQAHDAATAAAKALAAARAAQAEAEKRGEVPQAVAKAVETAQAALAAAEKAAADAVQKAKNDVEFGLLVPAELADVAHQFAFKAELLKRDRKTVEAVVYTPVYSVPVVNPLLVKVEEPAAAKLDPKTGGELLLAGSVERLEGAKGEVVVSVTGLPAGIAAPAAVTVKAQENSFKFTLKIPAGFKPGDFPGVKISGTGKPYGTLPLKSREAVVSVKVFAPEPSPEAKPAG